VGQLHHATSVVAFTCISFRFAAPFLPGPNELSEFLAKALGFRGQKLT